MRLLPAVLLPLLALVAGCAYAPVVSYNVTVPPPTAEEVRFLTAGHRTPVVVLTSPFPSVEPARLLRTVTDAMPQLNQTTYVAAQSQYVQAPYVLLWHFAGASQGAVTNVGADLALASPGDDDPISQVHGQVDGVTGPDDPKFRALVEQMTLGVLWPPETGIQGTGSIFRWFRFP